MESATKNKQKKGTILRMIQQAFGEQVNAEDLQINELTEGYFNVAYEVILPDKEVILKIAPQKSAKVMTYENNLMEAEVKALQLVGKNTKVPVPKVYYYDQTHRICDADYFIMEKLYGDSFYKLRCNGLDQKDQEDILHEVGWYNAQMNQLKGETFGYLEQKEKHGIEWRDTFNKMLEGILLDGESVGIGLGVEYSLVRSLVKKALPELEEVTVPRFVHWDLWDGNIFINNKKIIGFIDFERAIWGDPLMEYYFRSHSYNESFIKGYGRNLRKESPIRALLYDIYFYSILVIETKYRNYPEDGQYHFGVRELKKALDSLSKLV